jgi:carbonic anhydrase/acetyltransferase-like protein (isoleucine patch superfamily)
MLRTLRGITPWVAESAYVDPGAHVIGDVRIGERSTVWPGATLRGDIEPIRVGDATSIQEGSVVHTDQGFPATIGNRVTVGHMAVLHGCTVEDEALIGIGAIVLNGAKIGRGAVVAAGALVPEGMVVEPGMLVMGAPAKPRRAVSEEEKARFAYGVEQYALRAALYKEAQRENS